MQEKSLKKHYGRGHSYPDDVKTLSIRLLTSGMSIRGIAKLVGCNPTTILLWRSKHAEKVKNEMEFEAPKVVQMDELCATLKKK